MKGNATSWVFAALFVSAVIAFGLALHFRNRERELQDQLLLARARTESQAIAEPAPAPPPEVAPAATNSAKDDTQELRGKIRDLEASLKAKDDVIFSLRKTDTNQAPAPEAFWRRRQDWLDNLKTTDPTQYEAIVKARDESRQRVREAFARKAAHFLQNDTSTMSDTEQQHYTLMLQLLDETWKLSDQLRAENLPPDQRRELLGSMHDTMHMLSPLLDEQRDREFYNLGIGMGYSSNDAAALVTYITNVLDATSMRSVVPGRGGGPPPGMFQSDSNRTPGQGSSARMR